MAAPSIIGVLLVPSANASFGLLVVAYITAETWLGPAAAIVQVIKFWLRSGNVNVSVPEQMSIMFV